jgi:hypothetical protein
MPKSLFRISAALVIPCLLADPTTASAFSTSCNNFRIAHLAGESALQAEALASVLTFVRRAMPFTRQMKAEGKEISRNARATKIRRSHRRRWILVAGMIGLIILMGASPHYKDLVMAWADGSERLTFLSLVPISAGYALFVSLLSQAYLADESINPFRLDWKMVGRAVILAVIFSTPFEGGYYEKWLPALVPGNGWAIAAWRAVVDQIFSILFLDAINQYFQAWYVEADTREEAVHDIHLYTLRFFFRSMPLWLSTVVLANLFSRPIINFSIISIGMIIWDFQLNISIHDTTTNAAGEKPRSRWRSWPRYMGFYVRFTNWLMAKHPFSDVKALHRKKWYEKAMWGIAITGTLYTDGWLTYPLWGYLVLIAIALAVMSVPILQKRVLLVEERIREHVSPHHQSQMFSAA